MIDFSGVAEEQLVDALTGRVQPVHEEKLGLQLQRLQWIDQPMERLNHMIAAAMKAHQDAVIRLAAVPGLPDRTIPLDPASPLFGFFVSPGTVRGDGHMLVSLNVADSWFNPLAQLDLKTGRITRFAGDGVGDLHSGGMDPRWRNRRQPNGSGFGDMEVHSG